MFNLKAAAVLTALCTIAIVNGAPAEADVSVDATADLSIGKNSKVAAAWFAGWHEGEFSVKNVTWSKYTHMTYAFVNTNRNLTGLDEQGLGGLPTFVDAARQHHVKALLSIGGWTGSTGFSALVGSPENRTTFVKTVTDLATKYKLDGLDFDWEAPNGLGIGCNIINPNDTSNLLSYLQQLRKDPIGKKLILTAAAGLGPWTGPDGNPVTDVSGFAKVLDYVAIMNYDVWGPWSDFVGPNAPLDDTCASADKRVGSAVSAVDNWVKAGIPTDQLVLGVPSYGHSFRVRKANAFVNGSTTELVPYPVFDKNDLPVGDRWDDMAVGVDVCGNVNTQGGVVNYWGMVDLGYLDSNGKPKAGRPFRFDNCSQTAYSYDPEKEIMVSFDNTQTSLAKGKFIKAKKLRGFATWEAAGDYKDQLLDSIREGAGFPKGGPATSPFFQFPPFFGGKPPFGKNPFYTGNRRLAPFSKKLI